MTNQRRPRNEGSIYMRSDGRWVASVSLGVDGAGKRKRKVVYAGTRRDAHRKLAAALRDFQDGVTRAPDRLVLRAYLNDWLDNVVRPTVRPRTYEGYGYIVRVHVVPHLGSVPLTRLTPAQVQAFLRGRSEAGLSPRTVQYIHAVLRRAINQALRWGLVTRNVAALVDPPRVARPEVTPLTPGEARTLLAHVRGGRMEALYQIALTVGLRQGEALGLQWDDIDLDARTLAVRRTLQRVGGTLQTFEPKTARSRRTIALPDSAVRALREHRVRQLQDRLLAGSRWGDTSFVFTTLIGTPLDGTTVTHRFHRDLQAAGLKAQPFHNLRHACASFLLAQGVHPRVVMEMLGHSQIGITMNLYSHVAASLEREAADRIDALLGAI